MDLIWLATFIHQTLKEIHPESHYKWNHSKNVKYPYLTYKFNHAPEDDIRDLVDVDIDMFDTGMSSRNLLALETKLVNELHKNYQELDEAFVYIRTGRGFDIDTQAQNIQRRHLKASIKLDWKQSNKIKGENK